MLRTLVMVLSCSGIGCLEARADVVTEWNEVLLDAIRADSTAPPRSSRAMAMVHIAIYDAVNGIAPTHQSYLVAPSAPEGASPEAAAVAAAHTVLVSLFPAQAAVFDAARESSLRAIPEGQSKTAGVEWGESVGQAVLDARAGDGSALVVIYVPESIPGGWVPTPPGFAAAAFPQWPLMTPFAMTSGSQFREAGPPPLHSEEYAESFNDVKELGRADSSSRTTDQSEIALFWVNGPGTATPPGHWNSITQVVADQEGNSLAENARLFALLNIAMADAAIASWDNKYAYNNWRPVTAIPAADSDGNDLTQADPEWTSFIPTPPFPDYVSGHSTFSAAAAAVLADFFGRDDIAFDINSDAQPEIVRIYESFSQAAEESGRSRIYGGIHWQFSNADGLACGTKLGHYVTQNLLKPLPGAAPGPRACGALNLGGVAVIMSLVMFGLGPRRRKQA